jgi:acetyl esterase/lipase
MAINKAMRLALKALSYQEMDVKKNYRLKRQLTNAVHPYIRPLYQMWDHKVSIGSHEIPVRIFFSPEEEVRRILIFFHGGGWVTGNIDSYTAVCSNMAKQTRRVVISVDYRLAPEFKFPAALEDCYAVTREIFTDATLFDVRQEDIALIGDSAGGNLAAAVSLMARDKGEFLPSSQILLYPSTGSDHGENSPYASVIENGTDYLLTAKRINDYMDLYKSCEEDLQNPYLAPVLSKDLSRQPRTLIITAQYDPLRDEGELYGKRLYEFGNQVEVYRMKDALHGFITLPKRFVHVKRSYELINRFLNKPL